jgi:hypothetical protein
VEAFRAQRRRLEAVCEQPANHVVGEELHAAIGVVDDEELLGPKQLVADDQRPDGIIGGAAAGVANHVRIALREARVLRRIEPRVHAGEDGETTRRRQCQRGLIAKAGGIRCVRREYFVENFTHGKAPVFVRQRADTRCPGWR